MAHGKPDWNRTAGPVTTYQLDDLGENAARLGSIVTFDRRGDVVWFDDFEAANLHWFTQSPGIGGSAGRDTTDAYRGEASVALVTGSTLNDQATMRRTLFRPALANIGLECAISVPGASLGEVEITVIMSDGATRQTAGLVLDYDNDRVDYVDSAIARVKLTDFTFSTTVPHYHIFKLVFDADNSNYVRALVDHLSFDLSGVGVQSSAIVEAPRMIIQIVHRTLTGANKTANVDDVIVTQNEP